MARKCCVKNCNTTSKTSNKYGLKLHKFPKDYLIRAKWFDNCRIDNDCRDVPGPFICYKHFKRSDYDIVKGHKYLLKENSVPSVFQDYDDHPDPIIMPVKTRNVSYPQEDLDLINSKTNNVDDRTDGIDSPGYNDSCGEACNSRPQSSADSLNQSESQDDNEATGKLLDIDCEMEKVKKSEFKESPPAEPPPVNSSVNNQIKNVNKMENTVKKDSKTTKVSRGDLKFFPGAKLEAKDFNDQWYAARVVETDWVEREVLIHFDKWNSRFDEWIPMDSSRLRVLQMQPRETKPREFSVGERILATWADGRKYPAKIKALMGNDRYDILFDDGYSKVLRSSKMTKIAGTLDKSSGQQSGMEAESYIGSKQERRDKKRKHTVTELFNSRKRTKTESERSSKKDDNQDENEAEIHEANGSGSYDSGAEMLKGFPNQKKIKNYTKRKREYQKVDTDQEYDDVGPEWVDGEPQGIESFTTDGARRSIIVPDRRLPPGWQKHFVQRKTGSSAGKWDVLFVHKMSGKKFRSRNDLKTYFESQGMTNFNPDMFDFCIHRKKKAGAKNHTPKPESPVEAPRKIKTLLPKTKANPPASAADNLLLTPVTSALAQSSPAPLPVATPIDDSAVFIGGLRVEMEDSAYKCPIEGCSKTFRKENLLQMHIKHYHKEYSQFVGSTPNVADLAYARTIGESIQDVTPKKSNEKRKSLHERPLHSITMSPLTASIIDNSLTDNGIVDGKLEMMSPTSNSSMDVTDDGAHKSECAMSPGSLFDMKIREEKTQTGIKTLLPVRPSNSDSQRIDRSKSLDDGGNFEKIKGQRKRQLSEYSSDASTRSRKPKGMQELTDDYGDLDDSALDAEGPAGLVYRYSRRKSDAKSDDNSQSNGDGVMMMINGELVKVEQLKREEIINCTCGITEEDGLMIQCDLCLCWQHGHCNAIERERDVPDKYVCYICRNPFRGRPSKKYSHNQDWIKEGKLESLSKRTKNQEVINHRTAVLKRSYDLVGALIEIQRILHSLRVKINVVQKKDHPKLYLWAKNWEKNEIPEPQLEPVPIIEIIAPKPAPIDEAAVELPLKNEEIDDKDEIKREADKQISSDSELMKILEEDSSVINEAKVNCKKEEDEGNNDGRILLDALTRSEDDKKGDEVKGESEGDGDGEPGVPLEETIKKLQPFVPEPEAPIDPDECRLRLLEHIEHFQDHIDAHLATIEAQVDALETMEPTDDRSSDVQPRMKQTIQMLLRDLATVRKLAALC